MTCRTTTTMTFEGLRPECTPSARRGTPTCAIGVAGSKPKTMTETPHVQAAVQGACNGLRASEPLHGAAQTAWEACAAQARLHVTRLRHCTCPASSPQDAEAGS